MRVPAHTARKRSFELREDILAQMTQIKRIGTDKLDSTAVN